MTAMPVEASPLEGSEEILAERQRPEGAWIPDAGPITARLEPGPPQGHATTLFQPLTEARNAC